MLIVPGPHTMALQSPHNGVEQAIESTAIPPSRIQHVAPPQTVRQTRRRSLPLTHRWQTALDSETAAAFRRDGLACGARADAEPRSTCRATDTVGGNRREKDMVGDRGETRCNKKGEKIRRRRSVSPFYIPARAGHYTHAYFSSHARKIKINRACGNDTNLKGVRQDIIIIYTSNGPNEPPQYRWCGYYTVLLCKGGNEFGAYLKELHSVVSLSSHHWKIFLLVCKIKNKDLNSWMG